MKNSSRKLRLDFLNYLKSDFNYKFAKDKNKKTFLYTCSSPEAVKAIMKHGLMSGDRLYENKELLSIARPNKEELDNWTERYKKDKNFDLTFKGPNCFFSKPVLNFLDKEHPILKQNLKFIKINLDKILNDYELYSNLNFFGLELSKYRDEMTDREYLDRMKYLTIEEVKGFAHTDPEILWATYNKNSKKYAADVPHVVILIEGGIIDPKYLELDEE